MKRVSKHVKNSRGKYPCKAREIFIADDLFGSFNNFTNQDVDLLPLAVTRWLQYVSISQGSRQAAETYLKLRHQNLKIHESLPADFVVL